MRTLEANLLYTMARHVGRYWKVLSPHCTLWTDHCIKAMRIKFVIQDSTDISSIQGQNETMEAILLVSLVLAAVD